MIGIFDSGIGGLTVVRALKRRRPDLSLVYLGDTARTPYGAKSPETIRRYSEEATDFLLSRGAKAVIIACNTASSLAAEHLRVRHPDLPIFEVVSPAVKAATAATRNGRIGVIGTRATIMSGVYEKRLKAKNQKLEVFSNPAPLLVSLAEEGWLDDPETSSIIGRYLKPLVDADIDTLILGCTHYPLLAPAIRARAGEGVRLVDSAESVAEAFCATIDEDARLSGALGRDGRASYCVTDPTPTFATLASQCLGETIEVAKVDLPSHPQ